MTKYLCYDPQMSSMIEFATTLIPIQTKHVNDRPWMAASLRREKSYTATGTTGSVFTVGLQEIHVFICLYGFF